jgi:hypothetical protein
LAAKILIAQLLPEGGTMKTGMLWFDNDPKTALNQKVQQAAEYFHNKYGQSPDLCLVHPSMMPEEEQDSGIIKIRPWRTVTPGHLWIGVDEKMPLGAD